MTRSSERTGRSGEFAVCSWLSQHSDLVNLIPHSSHADIIFEYQDYLFKCQVKTTTKQKKYISRHTGRHYRSGWCWDLRRSSWSSNRSYEHKQIDLYAMYCKPKNKIVWLSANSTKRSKITFTDKAPEDYDTLKGWNDSCEQAVNREFKFIKLRRKT